MAVAVGHAAIILPALALAFGVGWRVGRARLGRHECDAATREVLAAYPHLPSGRDARHYPPGRYDHGG